MGNRFRLIVNEVDVVQPEQPLPKLPLARAVCLPKPSPKVAAAAWIYAGGAHHTGFSQALRLERLEDFAEIAGRALIVIDGDTSYARFASNCAGRNTLTPVIEAHYSLQVTLEYEK